VYLRDHCGAGSSEGSRLNDKSRCASSSWIWGAWWRQYVTVLAIRAHILTLAQVTQCKNILSLVLEDASLLLYLIQILQPVVDGTTAPVTKKARLDGLDIHGGLVVPLADGLIQATKRTVIHCRQTPTVDSAHRSYWRKQDVQRVQGFSNSFARYA